MSLTCKKKKKICFFLSDISDKGGIQRVVVELANQLVVENDIIIISLTYTLNSLGNIYVPYELSKNVSLIGLYERNDNTSGLSRKIKCVFLIPKIFSLIRHYSIEFFVSMGMDSVIWSFIPSVISRVRYICCDHTTYARKLNWAVRGRFLSKFFADDIVVLTERERKYWNNSKVVVINNASPFQKTVIKNERKQDKIISIGRLVSVKGFFRLIDAWEIVEDRRKESNFILEIIGDGELFYELNEVIKRKRLKRINIKPFSNNIEDVYQTAKFVLLSSFYEGFSMVLVEALSFGLPSIAFDVDSGPSEIIINEYTGYLVSDGDIEGYADKIIQLIDCNETLDSLSRNCLIDRVRFDKENILKKWINLLEKT